MAEDADEFFFCPQAAHNVEAQRKYQQRIMGEFSSLGVEEMRFVRIPYSARQDYNLPVVLRNVQRRFQTISVCDTV